ncbi:MAG: choice-of-anchor Q domain-containing protein, partial [Planctomycetota bacterium]
MESRQLLAAVTVDNATDVVDNDVSSIAALIADATGDNEISLREAITAANNTPGADIITFDAVLFDIATPQTITIGSTLPLIDDPVSILGPGALTLTIDAGDGTDNTPDTGDGFRIFDVDDGSTGSDIAVTISGMTLTGGDVSRISTTEDVVSGGGAIRSIEDLTVSKVEFVGNGARSGGGLLSEGGDLVIEFSTFDDNSVSLSGGAIDVAGNGTATFNTITVSGNDATRPTGSSDEVVGGGIALTGSRDPRSQIPLTVTMHSVTVTDNDATVSGDALYASPEAIVNLDITNSIFTDGIFNDPQGTFTGSHNLLRTFGATTGGTGTIRDNRVVLAPLELNLGTTRTHALVFTGASQGALAIDSGSTTEPLDQRDLARPDTIGGVDQVADKGAFEAYKPQFLTAPFATTTENQVDLIDVDATDELA